MQTILLHNNDKLPSVGLGLWKMPSPAVANIVQEAIRSGYRHLDSACDYGNEPEVGRGIAQALAEGTCKRQELWVTSKLWNTYHAREHVRPALERSLRDLCLDFLDLYLIHFPIAQQYVPFDVRYPPEWVCDSEEDNPEIRLAKIPIHETWAAMEDLVRAGLVRHIGICNFGTSLLRDLLSCAQIRPSVLQVERHPYLVQEKLLRFCKQENIALTGFSPLGAGSYLELGMAQAQDSVLSEACVQEIAEAHGKTPAQVVLRWGIEQGTSVIPKTNRPERLRENLDLYDFALTEEQMGTISNLDRNQRFNDPGVFCELAFNTFCPIYE